MFEIDMHALENLYTRELACRLCWNILLANVSSHHISNIMCVYVCARSQFFSMYLYIYSMA
jgi:hypothetical protein